MKPHRLATQCQILFQLQWMVM
uniref:Uncharacterized protein n=1 Tax=Anguilla anguilla TaxID=7936 RepID=A0A0E9U1I3_ANGAN